jgi:hypothetical protein
MGKAGEEGGEGREGKRRRRKRGRKRGRMHDHSRWSSTPLFILTLQNQVTFLD